MTDFRFRRLEQFRTGGTRDRMTLSIPLPKSPKGRIHRYCPTIECVPRRFQLGSTPEEQEIAEEDRSLVRRLPGQAGTTCPYCGLDAGDEEFTAQEDIENAQRTVKWAAKEDIGKWADDLAKNFNRGAPKGGLISMKMTTRRSSNPRPYARREDLLRGLTCDICGRDYGVYAIALFCPDCGARNVHVHFGREVAIIEQQVSLADNAAGEDEELAFRLLGNAHEDVLTALETYLRTIFLFLAPLRRSEEDAERLSRLARRGNPFQSIVRGERLFTELRLNPYGVITNDDRVFLNTLIQKRHVIGHNLGLADERYLIAVSDGAEGENIRLLGDDVRRFAQLAYRVVVEGIEQAVPELLPRN